MSDSNVYQFVQTSGHGYLKVWINELDSLNLLPLISSYSFVGNDEDDSTGLNEYRYAYLEEDCDAGVFIKALEHLGRKYVIDYDTLTEKFEEEYEGDDDEWLDSLYVWDLELLVEEWNYKGNEPDEDMKKALVNSDDEYDYEEEEEVEED